MEKNLLRQLKDIQILANSMLTQELTHEKIEYFYKYSEEIQLYIKNNINDELISKLLSEIPNKEFHDLIRSTKAVEIFNFDIIGLFTKSENNEVETLINISKDKYASIETLLK
ncbi:hypothetical protein [Flavobacterium pectinovorum]|uniref:Uncharacterized protein n=1 Tax=Flavobacterium pectinovorum TaxID=29533 RepID=A0A502EY85_9FLAO|nr:hypothetical protein [Flavobacterium pectinovorum]TPG42082.1 hypothetical protein EAH81_07100 [Flavobacterium pectinovorum]